MLGSQFKTRLLKGDISSFQEHVFTFFVSLLCATVYIASDVFLPSLPEIAKDYQTTPNIAQQTITVFVLGLSATQILHGLLADRFGKRNILLLVLPVFLLATIGCIFAPSIQILILYRLFQAISASACIVIGRSLFVDLFEAKRAQRAFAILIPMVSLSPALAPTIGGFLGAYFHWRSTFVFVLIFAIIVTLFVLFYLPETKPRGKRAANIRISYIFQSFGEMLTHARFLKASTVLFFGTMTWWIYVAGAPLMFRGMGLTQEQTGMLYFPAVIPYIIFSLVARHMLKYKPIDKIIFIGMMCFIANAVILASLALLKLLNVWTIMAGMLVLTASNGFLIGMSMALGIGEFQKKSGLAAGLMGTIQLLAGACASFITGMVADKYNANYHAWLITVIAIIGSLLYWTMVIIEKKKA